MRHDPVDWIFDWVIGLPMTLGALQRGKTVRLLCFLWQTLWLIPAAVVCFPIIVPFAIAEAIGDYLSE
jgi:hypothetical protein